MEGGNYARAVEVLDGLPGQHPQHAQAVYLVLDCLNRQLTTAQGTLQQIERGGEGDKPATQARIVQLRTDLFERANAARLSIETMVARRETLRDADRLLQAWSLVMSAVASDDPALRERTLLQVGDVTQVRDGDSNEIRTGMSGIRAYANYLGVRIALEGGNSALAVAAFTQRLGDFKTTDEMIQGSLGQLQSARREGMAMRGEYEATTAPAVRQNLQRQMTVYGQFLSSGAEALLSALRQANAAPEQLARVSLEVAYGKLLEGKLADALATIQTLPENLRQDINIKMLEIELQIANGKYRDAIAAANTIQQATAARADLRDYHLDAWLLMFRAIRAAGGNASQARTVYSRIQQVRARCPEDLGTFDPTSNTLTGGREPYAALFREMERWAEGASQ
jgi:hypothetical protein